MPAHCIKFMSWNQGRHCLVIYSTYSLCLSWCEFMSAGTQASVLACVCVCVCVWVSGLRGWVWQSCQVTEERVAKLLSATLEEQRTACHFIFSFFLSFFHFNPCFSPLVWLLGSSSQKNVPAEGFRKWLCVPVWSVGWCRCIYLWEEMKYLPGVSR